MKIEEQEEFHSKFISYNIPSNIYDLDKSSNHHHVKKYNNSKGICQ
ncbi:12940_t:CDS:2 [Funneliformis caledonium]|uniref:12940_t:CDS:1 n=1 Tax=Funneliformis caledonium TaxID=1117310 RepID=A0A9N9FMD7_9GLOM|nr:12940_t:CDS:2 [Funneliformis caledonium]